MKIKYPSLEKIKDYGKFFNPDKFWMKIKKYAKSMGEESLYFILLLYYALKDPKTPLKNKILIAGALGYLILPLDFIPDAVPVLGFSDDFAAIMTVYKNIKNSISEENKIQARLKTSEIFNKSSQLKS